MTNTKTTTWTPNPTQEKFLSVVSTEPHTLAELAQLAGVEKFATGSINPLVKKNLVAHGEEREIVCPMCGHKHKVKTWVKVA